MVESKSQASDMTEEERAYPIPADEATRLAALRELQILDTDPETEFDRITRLARILFGTQIAALSLVDDDRQWFKSLSGLVAEETPRDQAFCAHTILQDKPLVILDAAADPRFAHNPLVTGGPEIRFYAGAPLRTHSGARVGSLCVIDNKAREKWSAVEESLLKDLAELVSSELRSREAQKVHQRTTEALRLLRSQTDSDSLILDQLTRLPDRRALEGLINRAKSSADADDRFVGFIYIDVDNISAINDDYGETAGDGVLKMLAGRLRNAFRTNDFLLRIAGDQFFIILQSLERTNGVDRPIQKLLQLARVPVPIADVGEVSITVSAGVSFYPHSGQMAVELVTAAKTAMLAAKQRGGDACAVSGREKEITFVSLQP